ncbi:MAG: hypothetical protein PHQ35_07700 [Phycisphaerae bacterium]|nr:hypothetical protein [Phycisphaerae bacterium]MDD5380045.1 hypothetical protein [Phycisphaerae bacterium]
MKAEHRHELKTNELAEWLINFPQWVKKNATTIIYASVIIVVAAGIYFWKVYEKRVVANREQLEFTNFVSQIAQGKTQIIQAQAQGIDTAYALIQAADNLQNIAQNARNEQMAALSLIKEAETRRMELHYRFGNISRQDLEAQINRAKDTYTKAIEKSSANPSLMAMAKLGVGLCEEELGYYGQAEQIYSEITANPDFEGTIAAAQAKQRLLTMLDYQQQVVFLPAPKQPVEFIQPEIKLVSPEGIQTQGGTLEAQDLNAPTQ